MFTHYETVELEGKPVIAVHVQRGTNRPYYLVKKGLRPEGVYVRQAYSSVSASDAAIRQMIKETDGDSFDELLRIDNRDYPEVAVREALLNSLVHRDYSFHAATLISIYPDHMEFVSLGGLPTGLELADIKLGISVCRNPHLANIFYRL